MDPLGLLARRDKWFLGGGRGAIYAPPFPRFLTAPGFWDECYFADIRHPRLFTVLFAREGRPVRLVGAVESWRPDRLTLLHRNDDTIIRETRVVLEDNTWASRFELLLGSPLQAFVWSLLDMRPAGTGSPWQSVGDASVAENSVSVRWDTSWPTELEPDRTAVETEAIQSTAPQGVALPIHLAIGADAPRRSWTVNLAQRHDESPLWETSLLPQKLRGGRLPGDFKLWVGTETDGLAHFVQQYELSDRLTVAARAGLEPERLDFERDVVAESESSWRRFFAGVPQFDSSDPFLNAAYWYRWYGIRLNTVDLLNLPFAGGGTFAPFVTEGIGFFRNFVTYSAQAHLREVMWMQYPSLAIGILDNLALVQREDGSFPGHNYSCRPARDFYHADFGTPMLELHALHPGAVDKAHTGALRRYADYLLRVRTVSRDPAGPTLYDVFDQNETGQEYMSRYQFASENADRWASFRVHGVDATVYAAQTFRALAYFRQADSSYRRFHKGAVQGLRELARAEDGFTCDVDLEGQRSWARPLTGLYAGLLPELADTITPEWVARFEGDAGFAATALDDPTFSADGEWKERRLNCPWNGRSWPMANSHLVDAVATAAEVRPELRPLAARVFTKAIRLMFHDSDPARPCSYEHYDPLTGTPALYRGYDDYMHSWIVDLILRHAVGVRTDGSPAEPLPLDVAWIECDNLPGGLPPMSRRN